MKIAVNVVCLTKKTEAKSDDRERSYDFMNAGIQKRKISPFRDASALMVLNNERQKTKGFVSKLSKFCHS